MSRVLHIDADQKDVLKLCADEGATVSAVETLASGGTRVVLTSSEAALAMKKKFGKKVLSGTVKRTPLHKRAL